MKEGKNKRTRLRKKDKEKIYEISRTKGFENIEPECKFLQMYVFMSI
jgi:hypothetical protein